jgi:hypothetical protein
MENQSKRSLENYFKDNGYSDLEVFGEGIDKYINNSKSFKRYSGK